LATLHDIEFKISATSARFKMYQNQKTSMKRMSCEQNNRLAKIAKNGKLNILISPGRPSKFVQKLGSSIRRTGTLDKIEDIVP